mgnify:CR=1 FL=1
MKKIYFLLLVLATVFVACKKDMDVEFSTFEIEDEKFVPSYTSTELSCKVQCAATINELYLQYDTVADFSTYQEVELVENEKTEVYSVKIGELLDNTTYYVRYVAENSYSQVTSEKVSEFKTLQATTPTIEVREITDVLDTVATVGFVLKFNGGADITKMGVCWSMDSVPTVDDVYVECSSDVVDNVVGGDSLVLNISGLKANTTYYVRAYAENIKGIRYSQSKAFVTLTLPEVETEDVTDIQLTSGWLNGLVLFNGNDTTTEYGFCWGEEADLTIEESQNVKVEVAEDSTFTYRLSNLQDETKYYVRAYAKNKIGLVYGEVKEFTTQSTILAVVVTAEASDVTYTSAKVGGKVETDGGSDVEERGICYSITKSPTIENKKVVLGSGLGSFTTELSDLQDGTKYYVRAYAKNKKGVSYGETVMFETKAYLLAEVITSSPTEITYTTAVVGGTVVSDGGVEVVERGVCYSMTENPTIADSKIVVDKGLGSFSITLSGLQEGAKYYVRAYAINKKGVSYGDEVTFETLSRFVDLGLSVNWAMCNVGADKPEDYGDYFAWGEVKPKTVYDWSTYKYSKGSNKSITKYCTNSVFGNNGFVDNKIVLDLADDAAHVNLGGAWRMPTKEELEELKEKCTWEWITKNGVNGYKVTSKVDGYTDRSIFLPAAGGISSGDNSHVGTRAYYRTSSLSMNYYTDKAYLLYASSDEIKFYLLVRTVGCPIRAVIDKNSDMSEIKRHTISVYSDNESFGKVLGGGTYAEGTLISIKAIPNNSYEFEGWSDGNSDNPRVIIVSKNSEYTAKFRKNPSSHNGYDYVDLGLSVKWATCNVGVELPEEGGDYFAWGETIVKDSYVAENYKFSGGSGGVTKYNDKDYKVILDLEDDAAHVNWGGEWRMPTIEEFQELLDNCTWTSVGGWDSYGIEGFKITGKNGNSIFLPMPGYMATNGWNYHTYYQSASLPLGGGYGHNMVLGVNVSAQPRSYTLYYSDGCPIRPVLGEYSYPPNIRKYKILVSSIDDVYGYAFGAGIYVEGKEVELSARAEEGYEFVRWNDGNTENPRKIVVTQNVTYIAIFEKAKTYQDGHEYVDLGLPSGLKWATCNVGATKPEEYGDYFAWGEVEPKEYYEWSTYKYCNGSKYSMTKYCTYSNYGIVDNNTMLDHEDDAATVNWGGAWRMPTKAEQDELRNNCTWDWTTQNGVNGYKVIGPNGNSIFLPAAGFMHEGTLTNAGSYGDYRSSSLEADEPYLAYIVYFYSDYVDWSYGSRCSGLSVRPVYGESSQQPETKRYTISVYSHDNSRGTVSGGGTYNEGYQVTITATAKSGYKFKEWNDGNTDNPRIITVTKDAIYTAHFEAEKNLNAGHEYVDLGLPSGLKWAICNVGATTPEEYGDYFAWGEVEPKTTYNWDTYKYYDGSNFTKYTGSDKTVLDPEDDAATANWGGAWRMPTKAEQDELRNNCTWTWITQSGVNGYKVTGPNGNSIFLPAAGQMSGGSLDSAGSNGLYWSSSLSAYGPNHALYVSFNSYSVDMYRCGRYYGYSVRPVCQ